MTAERKHRFWSDDHEPTERQKRHNRRLVRQRRDNRREENFGRINWRAYPHRDMWDMVKSADPALMAQRTHAWQTLAGEVDEATAEVRKVVQRLLLSWRGPSAVVAADSASRLTAWAADAGQRAYRVGEGLDAYTSAVQEAARRMPEPVHPTAEQRFRQGYDVTTLSGPEGAYLLEQLLDDHMPSKAKAQEAKAEAVRVMEQYETASRDVRSNLPTFDQAPPGAQVVPDAPPSGGGAGVRPVPQPELPPVLTPRPPAPLPVPHPAPHPAPDLDPVPDPASDPVADGGTTAVSSTPGQGVGHAPGGGYGFGPTGHAPGGGFASGFGAGYGTGYGEGRPGGVGPLGAGGASGVVGPVPGGAAARGGVGPVGVGGPQGFGVYPPMAAGPREEDKEHRNRYDLGLDLLDDLPPAFPPVLGE